MVIDNLFALCQSFLLQDEEGTIYSINIFNRQGMWKSFLILFCKRQKMLPWFKNTYGEIFVAFCKEKNYFRTVLSTLYKIRLRIFFRYEYP